MAYQENEDIGRPYREKMLKETQSWIEQMRDGADVARLEYWKNTSDVSIEEYQSHLHNYRADFVCMLGSPLLEYKLGCGANAEICFVADDELGQIYRVEIEAAEGLTAYGLLFLPDMAPPYDLVLALHGKEGVVEFCSSFRDSSNYNDMILRLRKRKLAIYVPQIMIWSQELGPELDQYNMDSALKQNDVVKSQWTQQTARKYIFRFSNPEAFCSRRRFPATCPLRIGGKNGMMPFATVT